MTIESSTIMCPTCGHNVQRSVQGHAEHLKCDSCGWSQDATIKRPEGKSPENTRAKMENPDARERWTANRLLSPRRIALAVVVLSLCYLCGPCLWESVYTPTLTPKDHLDRYCHRFVSIIGKYEKPPYDSDQLGFIKFGDEIIWFYVLPQSYALLKSLKGGETICVTGYLLYPNREDSTHLLQDGHPLPVHTITRARVERVL